MSKGGGMPNTCVVRQNISYYLLVIEWTCELSSLSTKQKKIGLVGYCCTSCGKSADENKVHKEGSDARNTLTLATSFYLWKPPTWVPSLRHVSNNQLPTTPSRTTTLPSKKLNIIKISKNKKNLTIRLKFKNGSQYRTPRFNLSNMPTPREAD